MLKETDCISVPYLRETRLCDETCPGGMDCVDWFLRVKERYQDILTPEQWEVYARNVQEIKDQGVCDDPRSQEYHPICGQELLTSE